MKLPVLIYHDVASPGQIAKLKGNEKYYCLEQSKFRAQLALLADEGYRTVTSPGTDGTAAKPVMLTFDDGLERHYACFQQLREHHFAGVFFIVTDFVGKPGYLAWPQINEMSRQGMSIQSHTCSHPILTTLGERQLRHEFESSRQVLEAELGRSVDAISIPQGFADTRVLEVAAACGYRYIFTSEPGLARPDRGPVLKRLTIFSRTSLAQFRRLTGMHPIEVGRQVLYKKMLALPKAAIGAKNYHRFRTVLLKRLN